MTTPHIREEKRLRKLGYQHVAGLDEAGKGAWAGPIVAAAVVLPDDFNAKGIRDSKQLTPRTRERLFVRIAKESIAWAVHAVDNVAIDRRGIQPANVAALTQAAKKLHLEPHALLVDAVKISWGKKPVKAIIKGDTKILSIAAASIVAKVVRDALMDGAHRLYPEYGFKQHKGYGTARHFAAIERHGLAPIHRKSFRPMNGRPKLKTKKKHSRKK